MKTQHTKMRDRSPSAPSRPLTAPCAFRRPRRPVRVVPGRCCPRREALLTGLYSHQASVGHMVNDFKLFGYRGVLNDWCATMSA